VFEWSLGATLLGSSTVLAIGSAPLWIEYAAAGILWSIVVLFLGLMAAASWFISSEPLPDYLKHHRERGVPLRSPGGWTGYLVTVHKRRDFRALLDRGSQCVGALCPICV
jgi:hypothetical protein